MTARTDLMPSLAIVVAAVLWGCWWIPLRALDARGLSGDWATVGLGLVAALLMLPAAAARWRGLRAGGWPVLLVGGLAGAAMATWNHAIIGGDVVRVTLLFYLAPIWATGLAVTVLGERLEALRVLAIVLGLGGAAVVLGVDDAVPAPRSQAEWMALGSGVLFALAATCARRVGDVAGFEKTFVTFAAAAAVAVVFAALPPAAPAPAVAVALAALPLLLAVAGLLFVPLMWLLLWATGRLDPGRVTVLLLFEVAAATVSATLLTDEPFGWREAAGCLLIVGAGVVEGVAAMRRGRPGPRAATVAALGSAED